MPCPFEAKLGFATKETRQEFLDMLESSRSNDENDSTPIIDHEAIESLQADPDISKRLYFWQLYSILGKDPILEFITTFYRQVFADDEQTEDGVMFRDAFVNVAPKDMHIKAQTAYWIDAFGGGRVYWGGHSRLGFHHSSRHSEPVMTAFGARRWMRHMRFAISSYDFVGKGYTDPRILPCLVDFLRTKVRAYADEYGWKFDDTDFEIDCFRYPPKLSKDYKISKVVAGTEDIDVEIMSIGFKVLN